MEHALVAADLELVERATEITARRGDGRINTVAAAARAVDGRIVTGMNVYHFTGGLCAIFQFRSSVFPARNLKS